MDVMQALEKNKFNPSRSYYQYLESNTAELDCDLMYYKLDLHAKIQHLV
jgi:hypothetical protein